MLCYQPAFSQATTKTQAQLKAEKQQAAEVKEQIAEAMFSKKHAGNHVISYNKNTPNVVKLNGKKYHRVKSNVVPYFKYTEGNFGKDTQKHIKVETFVNGKDTIQAAVFPNREEEETYEGNLGLIKGSPNAKLTSHEVYGKGNRIMHAEKSADGNSYSVHKFAHDPKTGNSYILRVKRNTTHPQSRTDITGGTYQSVKHTDIGATFGPYFQNDAYGYFGSETRYK